ncbi:MAG: carboxypeptidase-like regulatory domain-containing protein [Acidobacteria bacterium]|nr:carboxypeptidase-like regulatory domain-containing protein [Acidobacteriota bacterium]
MLPAAGARLAGGPPYTVLVPGDVFAQQSVVQVVAASQFTTGDAARVGSQARVEPDLGIQVITPALHIGNLYADINVTRRDDRAIVGRAVMRLDGVRAAGLSWAVNAGDTWTAPVMPDFGFANLFAPPVTFQGVSINGSSPRTFLLIGGGRVTAQRNIFGTDTVAVGQNVYQGLFSHRQSDRLDILARGAYVQSEHVQGYSALTDRSVEGGAGFRFRPTPSLEIVGDGGVTRFRRTGSSTTEVGPTLLVGTLWSARRGWLQLNAQRFALGHYPVINYAYTDRAGVFASGEWDLSARTRAFGGAEHAITNLDPAASSQATTGLSPGAYTRAFGGLRVGLFESSIVSVRVEQGGRRMEPSRFSPGFQSDTGVVTAEWHGRFSGGNAFARYERRANVNPDEASSDFTQHDASGQVYFSLAGMRQVFAQVTLSRRADQTGTGQTLWLVGGGAQLPLGRLYFRVESTVSRMLEWSTQIVTPRQTLSTGISGQIANRTYLSVDCYLDHSRAADASVNPWVTRTMVRLTRAFPFGSARSPQMGEAIDGPTGRVTGIVFADWDGNGMMDTDEEVVSGISLSIGPVRSVTSAADGRFAFNRVPVGDQVVRVDLATLPADYDPPAEPERPVTVGRGQAAAVDFGLVPLGSFHGMVYQDVDGNGQLGPADTPIDGAVLVMDDGARTEVARQGRFTFDPVRMGTHTVNLLLASLPDGAQVAGSPTATVELGRNQMAEAVVFLVKVGKRQEIRKVFPPKK